MKPCGACGSVLPDEAFALDRTRPDGLAWLCLECNKLRCEQWRLENLERKRAYAREYRRTHPDNRSQGTPTGKRRIETRQRLAKQTAEEEASELHLVRFTADEWDFCLLQGGRLGIKAEDYVRYLVKDARRLAQGED